MNELIDIQNAVLAALRPLYAESVFDLWFRDLVLAELDEKHAVFHIDSDFKQNILKMKYIGDLKQALEVTIGFSSEVEILSTQGERPVKITQFSTPVASKLSPDKKTEVLPKEPPNIGEELESKKVFNKYTFDNFIVGESNKFAHAACLAVADNPDSSAYNPLFIHGGSGLGKTHLLYAITNKIKSTKPDVKIIYKKGDAFTNELVASLRAGSMQEFRDKYRSADVLLIDDIQFIAGKESTQEEIFHTFNALYDEEKQVILTSDRPPRDIKTLAERLRTRFEGGLIADIQPPNIELRAAIILNKAEALGITIPEDAVAYLSEKLTNSIRTIEGAIKKISAVTVLTGMPVTLQMCREAIASLIAPQKSETDTIDKILEMVSDRYSVTVEDIKSKKRTDAIAKARHLCVYLIRQMTELSWTDIGKIFNRDHTTIIASNKFIKDQIDIAPETESEINEMIATLKL